MPTGHADPSGTELLSVLDTDQTQAWAAVRARLGIDTPWLTAALFRAVPVAVDTTTERGTDPSTDPSTDASADAGVGAGAGPGSVLGSKGAVSDRWGRIYVDFTVEASRGIAALAADVRAAVLDWTSGQTAAASWFANRLDDRFPAVSPAQAAAAAHATAAGLASDLPPAHGRDLFEAWREWAMREAGLPQVSWRQQLGAGLRGVIGIRRGHQIPTYSRLGRRQQPGLVLPAHRNPEIHVAMIADISGSAAPDLPTIVAEVGRIVAQVGLTGGTLTLYAVDDEVASVTPLPARLPDLSPREGHRTDLRVGFTAAARGAHGSGRRPDVTVVLTDGLTEWPDRAPAGKTIVALVGPRTVTTQAADDVPDWAHIVRIDTTEGLA